MNRGFTLISSIATIGIIAILAAVYVGYSGTGGKSPRADGRGKTTLGLVKANAQDEVCKSNLSQVRQSLMVAQTSSGDDSYPATLEETRIGADFYKCPMGKEPYVYDPKTGKVYCPHPGHEKY